MMFSPPAICDVKIMSEVKYCTTSTTITATDENWIQKLFGQKQNVSKTMEKLAEVSNYLSRMNNNWMHLQILP